MRAPNWRPWLASGAAAFLAALPCVAVDAADNEFADGVDANDTSSTIAPYLWALDLRGSIGIEGITIPFDVGVDELAGQIKAGGMGYIRRIDGPHMIYLEGLGIRFDDDNLDIFRDLPVAAEIVFAEAGYGRRFALASALPNGGDITVTPYIGVRYAKLDVLVKAGRLELSADEEWIDPALGLLVEGPVKSGFEYALKLDGAGFGVGKSRYTSGALYLGYRFNRQWFLGAGYRMARFNAEPGGPNDLEMDLSGSGPVLGLAYAFRQ
ncbi:MAG: hypothetical protein ACT4PZ_11595 [Panacagrimonas sp.]